MNQMVKAVATSRRVLIHVGFDLNCVPAFLSLNGKTSALKMVVWRVKKT
ncbi:stage V sporulation protein S [Aneurinibacillus migulanus]